jgi:hypothetical protein
MTMSLWSWPLACALFLSAATMSAQTYNPPKTPWGDPDLQGIWPGNMGVPMQRPATFGERATLTEDEFAKKEEQAKRQAQADSESTAASDTKAGIGPPSYWTERGKPTHQASLIIDPPNGRLPDLTPEAEKYRRRMARQSRFSGRPEHLLPLHHARPAGLEHDPGGLQQWQRDFAGALATCVIIRNEMIHESRVIPLDGRPHVGRKGIRQYMGDSRGHWEGNTLVIETTNFTDKDAIGSNGAGYPGDPGHHSDNYKIIEYACHEGNYAMTDILSGARATQPATEPRQ